MVMKRKKLFIFIVIILILIFFIINLILSHNQSADKIMIPYDDSIYYSDEENLEMVKSLYLESDNDEVNSVVNKMLDQLAVQNTIVAELSYDKRFSDMYLLI